MTTEIVKPHPQSLAAQANEHQLIVAKGWVAWRKAVYAETGQGVQVSNPQLEGSDIKMEFAGCGLIADGLMHAVTFLRWLQDNEPAYDETKVRLFIRMNETLYPVLAGDDLDNCKATVERVNEERADAYRKSPKGIEAARKSAAAQEAARLNLDQLIRELRSDFDYLDMGRWLVRYIEGQDRVGSGLDPAMMNARFEQMGYVRGEGVFDPPRKPVGLQADIRYIVGQVMEFYNPKDKVGIFGKPGVAHPLLGEWAATAVRKHLESTIEESVKDE